MRELWVAIWLESTFMRWEGTSMTRERLLEIMKNVHPVLRQ